MNTRFGEMIGGARRDKKLTLRKLSQLVGISPSVLSEMEHGRRLPPKDERQLTDLAIVLGLNEKEVFELARVERQANRPKWFERLYSLNPEAALGLCRAQEATSDEDFLAELEKALQLIKIKEG